MKKAVFILSFLLLSLAPFQPAHAQVSAAERLVLDLEKLAQLKKILQEMYSVSKKHIKNLLMRYLVIDSFSC